MADITFDTLCDDTGRNFTLAEFLALPLHLRIGLILQGKLKFLHQGKQVDQTQALKSLMEASKR